MSSIKCPQCNLTNWAMAISCKRCGYAFQEVNPASPVNVAPVVSQAAPYNIDINSQIVSPTSFSPPNSQSGKTWNSPNPPYQNESKSNQSQFQNSQPKVKLAVTSMIFGIASFPMINMIIGIILSMVLAAIFGVPGAFGGFLVALLALPTGLITGITALVKANKRPREYGGKGFAVAGIVLSGFAIVVIPFVAAIAIPNLLAARRSANEGSAISTIRTIASAEDTYSATSGAGQFGDISQLAQTKLIDSVLGSGQKSGYKFFVTKTPNGCEISATPTTAKGMSSTGTRSFYATSEENWMIHAANKNGAMADRRDPVLDTGNYTESTYRPRVASQK